MVEIDGLQVLGLGLCFEDLPVGRKFRTIGRTLIEADLVDFIAVTGMTEVLFTNCEFLDARTTSRRAWCRPQWSDAFAEGLLVQATRSPAATPSRGWPSMMRQSKQEAVPERLDIIDAPRITQVRQEGGVGWVASHGAQATSEFADDCGADPFAAGRECDRRGCRCLWLVRSAGCGATPSLRSVALSATPSRLSPFRF